MSRDPDDVNKLTESTYKNVMEQFNPGLRNLVNLGKSYEKSVTAMNLAGRAYFDAVSKIGENAAVSPVSRELGVVLMDIAEVHKQVQLQLEESLKRFHKEIIVELEKKTEMDVKYMTATFKRYQSEHKMRQDSIDRSHADLKKLRRKSQGKHSSKYDIKETEYLESISSRQTDMQKFIADGCTEALLEEKRRFCFLVDKHCTFSYQMAAFHVKAKDILSVKLQSWQEKCCDASRVPDSILSMIESMNTPVSITPEPSPIIDRFDRNSDSAVPAAPPLKPNASHLVNMFASDHSSRPVSTEHYFDQESYDGGSMSRSTSVSSGINIMKKPQVKTVFRHTSENNQTLLSFNEDEIITLLIQEEKDGWLYGELETTGQRGWFPSSYCEPYSGAAITNMTETPRHSLDLEDFSKQSREDEEEEEQLVHLPPPDYSDSSRKPSTSSPAKMVSNGTSTPPFLGGGNPFATVRLRPTITNDRSAPVI